MSEPASDLPKIEFPTLHSDADALERQLLVFTRDITEIYKRERARAEELEVALAELKTAYLETIRSLAFVVEAKDAYTGQHLERCRVYGMALMQAIGIADDFLGKPFSSLELLEHVQKLVGT